METNSLARRGIVTGGANVGSCGLKAGAPHQIRPVPACAYQGRPDRKRLTSSGGARGAEARVIKVVDPEQLEQSNLPIKIKFSPAKPPPGWIDAKKRFSDGSTFRRDKCQRIESPSAARTKRDSETEPRSDSHEDQEEENEAEAEDEEEEGSPQSMLATKLTNFQLEAMPWIEERELPRPCSALDAPSAAACGGGILYDEMGLGKTLTMAFQAVVDKHASAASGSKMRLQTLVLCPTNVVSAWEEELSKQIKPGVLKVGRYDGRVGEERALEECDIVISTHSRMHIDMHLHLAEPDECAWSEQRNLSGKPSVMDELGVPKSSAEYEQFMRDAAVVRPTKVSLSERMAKQREEGHAYLRKLGLDSKPSEPRKAFAADEATAAEMESDGEKNTVADTLLSVKVSRRFDRASVLMRPRFADYVDEETMLVCKPLAKKGLYSRRWWRVILDEAHAMRNADGKKLRAALCLAAYNRWWVTGTPVHNTLSDAVAALLFLREPSVCTETPPAPPKDRRPDACMTEQDWRASLALPRVAYGRTTQELLDHREDEVRADERMRYLIDCKIHKFERAVKFATEEEREYHDQFAHRLRRVAQILQERRDSTLGFGAGATGRPRYVPVASSGSAHEIDALRKEVEGKLNRGSTESGVLLEYYTRARQACLILPPSQRASGRLSTKLSMLLQHVRERIPPSDKFIVYSKSVERVKEIRSALMDSLGISAVEFHGQISTKQRNQNATRFREDSAVRGLICQTDSGSVGLTFVVANHVIFYEPWFNPQIEEQAAHRVWRIGQKKNVTVTWLIIAGSIEEVVRAMAARKYQLAKRALGSRDRVVMSPSDVLRDVNELLMGQVADKYRERDGELEYRRGIEMQRRFDPPASARANFCSEKTHAFVAPFVSYRIGRFVPPGSVLWRLSVSRDDEASIAARASHVSSMRESQPYLHDKSLRARDNSVRGDEALAIDLDAFRMRTRLDESLFSLVRKFSASFRSRPIFARQLEASASSSAATTTFVDKTIDPSTGSNFAHLSALVETQRRMTGHSTVDPLRARLPNDFFRIVELNHRPRITAHYASEALVRDRHIIGQYDECNESMTGAMARGEAAKRLSSSMLGGGPIDLDCAVLVGAFSAFWNDPELARDSMDSAPASSVVRLSSCSDRTSVPESNAMWMSLPDRSSAEDGSDYELVDMSEWDYGDFVRRALVPAVSDRSGPDSSIVTCLLGSFLVAPIPASSPSHPKVVRTMYAAVRPGDGSVLGVACAIHQVRQPDRIAASVCVPGVFVRETGISERVSARISIELGRKIADALLSPPHGMRYAVSIERNAVGSTMVVSERCKVRAVSIHAGFLDWMATCSSDWNSKRTEFRSSDADWIDRARASLGKGKALSLDSKRPPFPFARNSTGSAPIDLRGSLESLVPEVDWPAETGYYLSGTLYLAAAESSSV